MREKWVLDALCQDTMRDILRLMAEEERAVKKGCFHERHPGIDDDAFAALDRRDLAALRHIQERVSGIVHGA